MSIWLIGTQQPNFTTITVDGSEVTSGSATIEYFIHDGATFLYLQADLATFSPIYATIACIHDTHAGFGHVLPIRTSFLNSTIQYLIRHSTYGTIGSGDGTVVGGGLDIRLA